MSDKERENDRRRHARVRFRSTSGGVKFTVRLEDQLCDILAVHDVSISGIRLELARQLTVGQPLELIAQEEDFSVSVLGTVRWGATAEPGRSFEYGVEFDNTDVDNNILFFMSLRKYLDSFDDVPLKEL